MQKNPRKPITTARSPLNFSSTLSKHGNPPNAASRNASTLNSDRAAIKHQNAMVFRFAPAGRIVPLKRAA